MSFCWWMMKALRGGPAGRRDSPVCEVNHPKRDGNSDMEMVRWSMGNSGSKQRQEMVNFNRNLVS